MTPPPPVSNDKETERERERATRSDTHKSENNVYMYRYIDMCVWHRLVVQHRYCVYARLCIEELVVVEHIVVFSHLSFQFGRVCPCDEILHCSRDMEGRIRDGFRADADVALFDKGDSFTQRLGHLQPHEYNREAAPTESARCQRLETPSR